MVVSTADIVLQYVCPFMGSIMASVMFAGKTHCVCVVWSAWVPVCIWRWRCINELILFLQTIHSSPTFMIFGPKYSSSSPWFAPSIDRWIPGILESCSLEFWCWKLPWMGGMWVNLVCLFHEVRMLLWFDYFLFVHSSIFFEIQLFSL